MYKKVEGEMETLLFVPEGHIAWEISDSTSKTFSWIIGGRGTTSPTSRAAGSSDRFGVTGWQYYDNDEWKEGDINLTCVEEDDVAGTSDSDKNVNETKI